MKRDAVITIRELRPEHKQRSELGYRFVVESRLRDKRIRKFFKHGEREAADAYVEDLKRMAGELAREDRGVLTDRVLLEQASRAARELAPYCATIEEAVRHYVSWREAEKTRDATPVFQVIARFMTEKAGEGISERHLRDLKGRLAKFSAEFGKKPISGINRQDISEWLLDLPLSAQSKINYRRVLHNLFAYAVKLELIGTNPVSGAVAPKTRAKRPVILRPDEVARLLESCGAEILPAIALQAFCGIRSAETYRLDWSSIDWEDSTIEISGEHAKRESHARFVTIPENAVEWIRPLAKRRGRIADYTSPDAYAKALEIARVRAGWTMGTWPANALRKTFISCHYESFGSIDETAKQAGTSVTIIHRHYRKLLKKKEALRLWEIMPGDEAKIVSM